MKQFFKHGVTLLLAALFTCTAALADSRGPGRTPEVSGTYPAYYPENFENVGVITGLKSKYVWTINGIQKKVSTTVNVHTLTSASSSLYSIKKGMSIAYKTNGLGYVTDVWEIHAKSFDRN